MNFSEIITAVIENFGEKYGVGRYCNSKYIITFTDNSLYFHLENVGRVNSVPSHCEWSLEEYNPKPISGISGGHTGYPPTQLIDTLSRDIRNLEIYYTGEYTVTYEITLDSPPAAHNVAQAPSSQETDS